MMRGFYRMLPAAALHACITVAGERLRGLDSPITAATLSLEPANHALSQAPLVTPGPALDELPKRQAEYDTCGYIDGVFSLSLGCTVAGEGCVTNYADYAMGCCQSTAVSQCTLPTTCMDYTQLPGCDSACDANRYIWKCNNIDYPYCFLLEEIFSDGTYTGWQCATTRGGFTLYPTPLGGTATTPVVPAATTPHTTTPASPASSGSGSGSGSNSNSNTNTNGDNGNGNTVNVNVGKSGAAAGGLLDQCKQFKSYIYIEYGFPILMALYLQ